ncbi:hypothetical protein [uncultured Pseudoalteromonas sp.]|uniref:hypothetical protein n=1 Tax=uncultured Pseudoalteromonas sp. TaxID=114053 RepID=UPI0025927E64|nr:hypothetical protein [uncultured Pseudoalteromonas sp.]
MQRQPTNIVNPANSDNIKQTSAYLKRRASRLRRKSNSARDESLRSCLLQMAERANMRANELYFTAS